MVSRFNGCSWTGWTGGCQVNLPRNYKDAVLGECGWNFGSAYVMFMTALGEWMELEPSVGKLYLCMCFG